MTTFSKLMLNPLRRQGAKLLTQPQALHAAVAGAFPPDVSTDESRILWRVDSSKNSTVLYIVGPEKPSLEHIVEQAGWATRPGLSADYARLLDSLKKGQRWRFELVANPTYSEWRDGKRGKVKAHVSEKHQLEWLYKKAPSAGFELAPIPESPDAELGSWNLTDVPQLLERKTLNFQKSSQSGNRRSRTQIVQARFSGLLEVSNADALRTTLQQGIGRARGYGCGLMTLARVER
ncbi:MAG: type I-E CRISPR-associated protein Cas6/Cse3/CasE [Corynebacterium casei]|uniref:type I-E CRISPR-associated protein Cas6/Cse3/CasE n=1 Tax=Corynebacterium casei TaxID=160386 RepID=UPI0026541843|nr:type I-E CRISPR-associated protein Cas6/Cse3/CasE [Corynebacterium casei]